MCLKGWKTTPFQISSKSIKAFQRFYGVSRFDFNSVHILLWIVHYILENYFLFRALFQRRSSALNTKFSKDHQVTSSDFCLTFAYSKNGKSIKLEVMGRGRRNVSKPEDHQRLSFISFKAVVLSWMGSCAGTPLYWLLGGFQTTKAPLTFSWWFLTLLFGSRERFMLLQWYFLRRLHLTTRVPAITFYLLFLEILYDTNGCSYRSGSRIAKHGGERSIQTIRAPAIAFYFYFGWCVIVQQLLVLDLSMRKLGC